MAYVPWTAPPPAAIGGLNSVTVYGENLATTLGLNHMVTLGSNVTVLINPSAVLEGLKAPAPSLFTQMLGSGIGGGMTFTIGSNTQVTWGRQFEVDLGPEKITVEASKERPLSKIICAWVAAVVFAHALAYSLITDDNHRASEVIAFQIAMDGLLALFMLEQRSEKDVDSGIADLCNVMFGIKKAPHTTWWEDIKALIQLAVITGAVAAEPIMMGIREGHFDGDSQDSSSSNGSGGSGSSGSGSSGSGSAGSGPGAASGPSGSAPAQSTPGKQGPG